MSCLAYSRICAELTQKAFLSFLASSGTIFCLAEQSQKAIFCLAELDQEAIFYLAELAQEAIFCLAELAQEDFLSC